MDAIKENMTSNPVSMINCLRIPCFDSPEIS